MTFNSFPWNQAGDFRTPILCPKIRSKLHARENVRGTLLPNKEIFKLKKIESEVVKILKPNGSITNVHKRGNVQWSVFILTSQHP